MRELWIIMIILGLYGLCLILGFMAKKNRRRNIYYNMSEADQLSMEMRRMRTLDYWNNPVVRELRIGRDETKFD